MDLGIPGFIHSFDAMGWLHALAINGSVHGVVFAYRYSSTRVPVCPSQSPEIAVPLPDTRPKVFFNSAIKKQKNTTQQKQNSEPKKIRKTRQNHAPEPPIPTQQHAAMAVA